MVDDAEVAQLQAENEQRLHARMEQQRAKGTEMTDEQLEAFVKERCVRVGRHRGCVRARILVS